MHAYMHMTRVISISDEAYGRLKAMKNGGSFSEAIIGLTGGENSAKRLLEIIESREPDHELADAIEEVYKKRGRFKLREVNL